MKTKEQLQYEKVGLPAPVKARRTRGSGSLFRKATSKTWHMQYYRDDFKRDAKGEPILDEKGNPIPYRLRVRECTNTTNERRIFSRSA